MYSERRREMVRTCGNEQYPGCGQTIVLIETDEKNPNTGKNRWEKFETDRRTPHWQNCAYRKAKKEGRTFTPAVANPNAALTGSPPTGGNSTATVPADISQKIVGQQVADLALMYDKHDQQIKQMQSQIDHLITTNQNLQQEQRNKKLVDDNEFPPISSDIPRQDAGKDVQQEYAF